MDIRFPSSLWCTAGKHINKNSCSTNQPKQRVEFSSGEADLTLSSLHCVVIVLSFSRVGMLQDSLSTHDATTLWKLSRSWTGQPHLKCTRVLAFYQRILQITFCLLGSIHIYNCLYVLKLRKVSHSVMDRAVDQCNVGARKLSIRSPYL